jgi:hypothetical protein
VVLGAGSGRSSWWKRKCAGSSSKTINKLCCLHLQEEEELRPNLVETVAVHGSRARGRRPQPHVEAQI